MGEGKLAAVLAVVCGAIIGYKWPKIRKQLTPFYRQGMKRANRYAKRGIQDAVSLFAGRATKVRRSRKRVLAKA